MTTIVAIGGGELRDLETLSIDRAIVKLSQKKNPKVLFISTASGDSLGYWETFQSVYGKKLGCETDVLFLIREKFSKTQIEKKILSTDIIYVGGGNTLQMLRIWRKYGIDILLRKAYEKGIILSGLSAGAICWFRFGSSDSRRFTKNGKQVNSLMRVSALNLLPITLSPHHIREKKIRERGLKEIMRRTSGVAIALDDFCALIIQDDEYHLLISKPDASAKKVFRKGEKIISETITKTGKLSQLLNK